jgi:hypothetical protein
MSYLLTESERYYRFMPPNEIDSIWLNHQQNDQEIYLGHAFLIGIQRLRFFAKLSGFKIHKMYFADFKTTAFIWFLLLYPLILLSNIIILLKAKKKKPWAWAAYKEIFFYAIHPKILFDGCLIVEFEKEHDICELPTLFRKVGQFNQPT